jgi:hypothetical protein
MATAPTPRASLLAGLRTGGVRSTSTPLANAPYTAAPSGSFNVTPFASQNHATSTLEEDEDQLPEMLPKNHLFANHGLNRAITAAVDGPNNRFAQQQQQQQQVGMNPHSAPFTPAFATNIQAQNAHVQAQALQMQLMQLELMKLQTLQAQQYQVELLAQAQRQQQPQNRRGTPGFNPPASASPSNGVFNLRSATISAQMRRANQAELLKSQLGVNGDDHVPMTAALGGRFGSRSLSSSLSKLSTDNIDEAAYNGTTVISGGTSLGNPNTNVNGHVPNTPSKSDTAISWRRGGNNNSVLSGNNRAASSPSVKVTPPPPDNASPSPFDRKPSPPAATATKSRPVPLRFSPAVSQPLPTVAIDNSPLSSDDPINSSQADDGYSTSSSKSLSSPTTPRSSSSNDIPLSPREEASKKLYEGLGIGRPVPMINFVAETQTPPVVVIANRMASQPVRQPRGPPSGTDELGPQNFATRLRRKAIGGLGAALMSARERREAVEAY